jgi:O-antigen ligase
VAIGLISLLLVAVRPRVGLLILIFAKPIIDATWNSGLGGINALKVVGAGLPILVIFRFLVTSDLKKHGMPMAVIWMAYLYCNLVSFAMIAISGKLVGSIEFILRVLNGFVGFYLFQTYFSEKKWFKYLLIAYLFAGLFPMMMGLYQAMTGTVWRVRQAAGLVRNVGIYHDAFAFRSYAYMTITAIILYWSYFSKNKWISKLFLIGYGFACSVVVFKIYSKAGYAIFALWSTIWSIFNRKIVIIVLLAASVLAANFMMGNKLFTDVATVFYKETDAITGEGNRDLALGGRMYIWTDYWESYKNAGTFNQMFGLGVSGGGTHNDYLRVLMGGGILGLVVYVTLLGMIGWKVALKVLSRASPLTIMALMIYLMWLLDTIGLSPGLYPSYQWYVWGFIGLALKGVEGLSEQPENETPS